MSHLLFFHLPKRKHSPASASYEGELAELDKGLSNLIVRFVRGASSNRALAKQILEIGDKVLRFYGW